jgi:alpha-L-fucosidase
MGFHSLVSQIYGANLAQGAKVEASSSFGKGYEPENMLKPGDRYWAAADDDEIRQFTVTLAKPVTFDRCVLAEPIAQGQRVSSFEIEDLNGNGEWQKLTQGTTIGHKRILTFPAITSSAMRVTILKSRGTPAISHFSLNRAGA